jgi:dihydroxyacetone kinase-like predicted kinase
VILTAEQVKSLNTGKNITVIPTRSIPQGFSALLACNPEFSCEENVRNMHAAVQQVKTGEITRAVKDSSMNGLNISAGDIIAIFNDSIINTFQDTDTAVMTLLDSMVDKESGIISVYYGSDITEDRAKNIENKIRESYKDIDIEMHAGGQPHYPYIISVE